MHRIDETIFDGTLEMMIGALLTATRLDIFDDRLFKQLSSTFVQAVNASLKMEMHKLPKEKQSTFKGFAGELIKPVKQAGDMDSFIKALKTIGIAKQNIVKRLQTEILSESKFRKFFDGVVKQLRKSGDWIADNKEKFVKVCIDFLEEWIIELMSSIAQSLQKKGA